MTWQDGQDLGGFDRWLVRWRLVADGAPVRTPSSDLLPVLLGGQPAMLKCARVDEEERGNAVLAWWAGDGAARVLAREGAAVVLERASGRRSLVRMAQGDRDDEACRVICEVAGRLHRPRAGTPEVVPLAVWFRALTGAAQDGWMAQAAEAAEALLADPQDPVVLHGDLHHGNVLDFGEDWRAIDPKGLVGERGFEFAALFLNPDLADEAVPVAAERFARRVEVVAEAAGLERRRLAQWVLAFAGLSAAWFLADGAVPEVNRAVGEMAVGMLAG